MESTAFAEERVNCTAPIDVLLLGDQLIFREGLRKLFEGEPGFNVVGDASDADQAMKAIADLSPDIVIVSLSGRLLPRMLRKLEELAGGSQVRTILLTTIENKHIAQAQELGVSVVLMSETSPQVLFDSARSVAAGRTWLRRGPLNDLADGRRHRSAIHGNRFGLTDRELEVVQAVRRGDSNKKIASQLSITSDTVKRHLTNIFSKVGVVTRVQLAVFAQDHKLTPAASVAKDFSHRIGWFGHGAAFPADRHGRALLASAASPGF
jgi:two-component system, NarL family, nitrate/nitrite response regulator NarL